LPKNTATSPVTATGYRFQSVTAFQQNDPSAAFNATTDGASTFAPEHDPRAPAELVGAKDAAADVGDDVTVPDAAESRSRLLLEQATRPTNPTNTTARPPT